MLQQWHHLIGDHSTLAVMQEEINLILAGRGDELARRRRSATRWRRQARRQQGRTRTVLPHYAGGYR
ncbi:hypothetical protein M8494_28925 [Serratia ureilytica]